MSFKPPFRGAVFMAIVVPVSAMTTACGASAETSLLQAIESGEVSVAIKFDQPGIGLREGDGSFTGLGPELTREIANRIAAENDWNEPELSYREAPAAQRETLIQNGEVHMVEGGYSISSDREEKVNFAGPYLVTHQALLVRADDDNPINELTDLEGRILCSTSGSKPAQRTKESLPSVQLQEYDTNSSCVEALGQGNVDALTSDAAILAGFAEQHKGEFKIVEMKRDDGSYFADEWYGIGLKKNDSKGTEAVNAALDSMIEDGTMEELFERNFGLASSIELVGPADKEKITE